MRAIFRGERQTLLNSGAGRACEESVLISRSPHNAGADDLHQLHLCTASYTTHRYRSSLTLEAHWTRRMRLQSSAQMRLSKRVADVPRRALHVSRFHSCSRKRTLQARGFSDQLCLALLPALI